MTIRRILAIDGGGALGIFPAAFLATIRQQTQYPIASYFDLIAGCSTGGVLALGLGLNLPTEELVNFYKISAPKVFGKKKNFLQFLTSKPIYPIDQLTFELQSAVGDKLLGNSTKRLVIPAWNCLTRKPTIYKTAHHKKYSLDHKIPVIEIALATSAAPHYFGKYTSPQGEQFLDGGLYAINPVMIAISEAVSILGWEKDDLRILSLGTTSEVRNKKVPWRINIYGYMSYQLETVLEAQSSAALAMARHFTGDTITRERVWRIDMPVAAQAYDIDETDDLGDLEGLGRSLAKEKCFRLKKTFFHETAEPFTPLYSI